MSVHLFVTKIPRSVIHNAKMLVLQYLQFVVAGAAQERQHHHMTKELLVKNKATFSVKKGTQDPAHSFSAAFW